MMVQITCIRRTSLMSSVKNKSQAQCSEPPFTRTTTCPMATNSFQTLSFNLELFKFCSWRINIGRDLTLLILFCFNHKLKHYIHSFLHDCTGNISMMWWKASDPLLSVYTFSELGCALFCLCNISEMSLKEVCRHFWRLNAKNQHWGSKVLVLFMCQTEQLAMW